MTVRELIHLLEAFDKEMLLCYRLHSEHCLLDKEDVTVKRLCKPRPDGWVHEARPDQESIEYLVFPGN